MARASHAPVRTLLFVPGDIRRRIDKALGLAASAVAIDLEDAVALDAKPAARATVAEAVAEAPAEAPPILVRVNGAASGLLADDLDALAPVVPRLHGLIVPMCAGPDDVRAVADRLDAIEAEHGVEPGRTVVIATVETAVGVLRAAEIALASPRLRCLLFGPADMAHDLGVEPTAEGLEFLVARSTLVLASRAAGIEPPIDGPYLRLDDDAGCATAALAARRLGFQGKMALHPRQIGPVADVFAPSADEIAWARAVVAAFADAEARGVSSIRLDDGTFVDYPVAYRAREILRAVADEA